MNRPVGPSICGRSAKRTSTPASSRRDRKATGPKITDKQQSERFKEAARKLGADQSADAFDRIVEEMARGNVKDSERRIVNLERSERLQVWLSPSDSRAINDFRFQARMPSRAAAVRELLRRGLSAREKR
jgi:hypothetical protein